MLLSGRPTSTGTTAAREPTLKPSPSLEELRIQHLFNDQASLGEGTFGKVFDVSPHAVKTAKVESWMEDYTIDGNNYSLIKEFCLSKTLANLHPDIAAKLLPINDLTVSQGRTFNEGHIVISMPKHGQSLHSYYQDPSIADDNKRELKARANEFKEALAAELHDIGIDLDDNHDANYLYNGDSLRRIDLGNATVTNNRALVEGVIAAYDALAEKLQDNPHTARLLDYCERSFKQCDPLRWR